jgi:hypothetical protein
MNWKLATDAELLVIAYHDGCASNIDRHQAAQELKNRAISRKQHSRTNYREKVHFR